ncbi:protein of unknown function [Burkholderia multivorans]
MYLPAGKIPRMEKLRNFLNSMSPGEQISFAERCGTTIGYLRKAISVGQLLRAGLCVAIERASNGAVTRRDLHPDDWRDIWPELAERLQTGGPPLPESESARDDVQVPGGEAPPKPHPQAPEVAA